MKPNRTKQFAVQFVVTYVIFVVVKMLESMVLDEHIAAQRILASIETLALPSFSHSLPSSSGVG